MNDDMHTVKLYSDACYEFKELMVNYDFTKPMKILNFDCLNVKNTSVKSDIEYMYAGCSALNCYFRQEDIICILKSEIDMQKETTCVQKSNEPMKFDEMMNIFIEFGLNMFDDCEFYISPNVLKYVELDCATTSEQNIALYTNASKEFKETIKSHDFTKPVGVLNLNELLGGSSDKSVKTDLTFGNSYNYCRIRQEDIICVRKKSAKSERRHHAKIYAAYANDSECCVMEWDEVNGHQTGTVAHHHFNLPENKSFAVFQKVYLDLYQCLYKDSNGVFVVSALLPIKKIMEMKRSGQDIKVINESKRTMVAWEDTPSIISVRKT